MLTLKYMYFHTTSLLYVIKYLIKHLYSAYMQSNAKKGVKCCPKIQNFVLSCDFLMVKKMPNFGKSFHENKMHSEVS